MSEYTFFTVSDHPRPIRLSESTRKFAWDSLHYVYGKDTWKTPYVSVEEREDWQQLSVLDKFDLMVEAIVKKAPVRICPEEKISGAATLGKATYHEVPAYYQDKWVLSSISHLTIDYEEVMQIGTVGLRRKIEKSMQKHTDEKSLRYLQSLRHALDCFELYIERYQKALTDCGMTENAARLAWVPKNPARNFHEAVQCIWSIFSFTRLCGNWPGIGRIDRILGSYLKKDLAEGRLNLEQAREILAHFFIKGCEWVYGAWSNGSGDAQHYQNIVLAGIDPDGNEVTNEVTYLVLEIIEELGISDFPITIRVNADTDERLLRKAAEVVRHGGGVVAFYDETTILQAITRYHYPIEEARNFANDGCWEVQIPGRTNFGYIPFDGLQILQHQTLRDYAVPSAFSCFEELYRQYIADLHAKVGDIAHSIINGCMEQTENGWKFREPKTPSPVISLFEHDCVENAADYTAGGTKYRVASPHIGGMADVVNNLYAIKKLVFEEKKCTLDEFMGVLKNDWQDNEALRQYLLTKYSYFGNDNDEVDALAARLLNDFADGCKKNDGITPILFPAGVSTFGRQGEWAKLRLPSAHGRKQGEILAPNCSPTPGTDKEGATAIIRSYCKLPLERMVTGAALDLKLIPGCTRGEEGLDALVGLIRGFVALGGYFVQMDVVDAEVLKDAQKHPENYQTLSVRVSGWNARFITLDKEWQELVITQTAGGI